MRSPLTKPTTLDLLEIKGLKKYYPVAQQRFFSRNKGQVHAVDDISFSIRERETFSLVGESGCGKTTTAKLILMLEKPTAGSILWRGRDINHLGKHSLHDYRCAVQAVFQDPYSSLDPRMKIGNAIAEPMVVQRKFTKAQTAGRVAELLIKVGLSPESARNYPHEFSGGQRQRIAIAQVLGLDPELIVLDEPVSALDVSIRAQIMNLLKDIQGIYGISYLLISHHLAPVRYMSHRIGVMYLGRLVELADTKSLFGKPLHPYTRALFSASLPIHPHEIQEKLEIKGEVGSPVNPPPGCRFHPRCPGAIPSCSESEPPLFEFSEGHWVACHLNSTSY